MTAAGDHERAWGRRRGVTAAATLLSRFAGRGAPGWDGIVGRHLAEASAPVGVDGSGRLRVIAQNEAVRREIIARGDHIMSCWNLVGTRGGRVKAKRPALELVCWVRADVRPPKARKRPEAGHQAVAEKKPVRPELMARAEAEIGAMRDAGIRELIVEARARSLAAAERRNGPVS